MENNGLNKKRRDAKKEICFALFYLCKKEDYEQVTVKDVCDRAGVTRMSFYRHFKNKEDVFIYFADDKFSEFLEILHTLKGRSLTEFLDSFLSFMRGYKESIDILIQIGKYSIMLDLFNKYFSYLWAKYVAKNAPRNNYDSYLVSFISGGFYNSTLKWFKEGCLDNPKVISNEILKIIDKYHDEMIAYNNLD